MLFLLRFLVVVLPLNYELKTKAKLVCPTVLQMHISSIYALFTFFLPLPALKSANNASCARIHLVLMFWRAKLKSTSRKSSNMQQTMCHMYKYIKRNITIIMSPAFSPFFSTRIISRIFFFWDIAGSDCKIFLCFPSNTPQWVEV